MPTPRSRRSLLAAGLAALAGCTDVLPEEGEGRDLELGEGRGLTVTETAATAPDADLGYDVSVLRDEIARSGPGLLEITCLNDGDEPITVEFGPRPPFSTVYPDDSSQFLLADGREFEYAQACLEPNRSEQQAYSLSDDATTITLESGESISTVLELWGNHRTDDCLPPGSYRFSTTAAIVDGPTVEWSFVLDVETIEVEARS